MNLKDTEDSNDCAGEGKQQFNWLTEGLHSVKTLPTAQICIDWKPLYTLHKCSYVQHSGKGCTESTVTWTPWQCGYTRAETAVQQT
jgi:hypothetical protein